jgi:hypothetical protein
MTSWLSSPGAHAGLLDELVKIGEDAQKRRSNKQQILNAAKAIGLAGLGTGAGYGLSVGLQKAFPKFFLAKKPVSQKMLSAAKIGLPILGFAGGILGSRYRSEMDKEMFGSDASNARR